MLYLDLLGQREAISALEDLTILRDNQPEYFRRFGETARKVWGVRRIIEHRLGKEMRVTRASVGYPALSVTIQMFADTIMIYFPWDKENPNAFITLYSLLVATAETVIVALASEIPIRGGLDVHIATEFNNYVQNNPANMIISGGDIWGPAPNWHMSWQNTITITCASGSGRAYRACLSNRHSGCATNSRLIPTKPYGSSRQK